MIDLLSMTQVLLKEAGFDARLVSLNKAPLLCFEDSALLGFCYTFESADQLLREWQKVETDVLIRFAPNFRAAGDKAWNVYCAFLSEDAPTDEQAREIGWIEEDLQRTRKIAACGIADRRALIASLLPLLPVQYQPILPDSDVTERLKRRVADISPNVVQTALDESVSVAEVVRRMGER
ncbi:hypothetical protein EOA13_25840 [Mesorhizobium sp. M7A.F.Ca.US.011.01.1.1]|uniref:hypothetical protein n=1 Tax=Mesorhizobium sp. M7A.F.Ca.US.011.01.1.1 TaxID=2496741 RepID=UPI000FCBE9FD|nr:hypothetical protein [Mesorhizobium sp. M7A.F.Ca.US.011.01.1.1]RUX25828.1 hypothetical protein EOA13_25840 [Mesorhizobium sp. M7A.F.Ca.US.011.01.1.1]